MRIGVMAAGAVGGYFGGRLAAAGHEAIFFARGRNLEALRRDGLKIESVNGDLHRPKLNATDDPKGVAETIRLAAESGSSRCSEPSGINSITR